VSGALAAPTQAQRLDARRLGGEALDLFAAGDHAAALDKFTEADALVPAPTLKLHIARCLDKLGRLREAAEVYRVVIATELASDAPEVHREARKQAVPELAQVLDATPTLRVTVTGSGANDATVTIDDRAVDKTALGTDNPIDPGHYRVEASVGDRKVARDVDVARGVHERLTLELAATELTPTPTPEASPGMPYRIAGWASIALGGAGFSLASIMGVLVLGDEADLLERCPERRCLPDVHDDARAFDTKRTLTTAGFIIGGVGVAAGITLLLLAPGEETPTTGVRPLIGPGFVGAEGSF
jgi:hypothetical protein